PRTPRPPPALAASVVLSRCPMPSSLLQSERPYKSCLSSEAAGGNRAAMHGHQRLQACPLAALVCCKQELFMRDNPVAPIRITARRHYVRGARRENTNGLVAPPPLEPPSAPRQRPPRARRAFRAPSAARQSPECPGARRGLHGRWGRQTGP